MATILVTGSNSGFGRLAALSLARGGHDVIATMRTPLKGEDLQVRQTVPSTGGWGGP
jgi:NAD(P)-dependent dehydrogenase (short-subunit alcohol dehydrogenase family)